MKKQHSSIDGFSIPRRGQTPQERPRSGLEQFQLPSEYMVNSKEQTKSTVIGAQEASESTKIFGDKPSSSNADRLTASPDTIETISVDSQQDKPSKKRRFSFKKFAKIAAILVLIGGLGWGGFFAWKVITSANQVFKGNIFNAVFSNKELKVDQYGRTNIIVFGTSEDDPGHAGSSLTDSIMIVSLDQKNKDAFLVSVPRDLWVKYGKACNSGYEGKINEVYSCNTGSDDKNEAAGSDALRAKVSEVFGINLQYSVHINYTVVRQAVDAVGGVDIIIESPDKRGIMDRNFDWRCRGKCYLVKWPNGPAHLDGEHALFLAQARGEGTGYGLPRGNFDRETNQRKIMIALKEKATSAGFLSNPIAVTNLLDSLGANVRTNIDAEEIKSFIQVAKELDTSKMRSLSLIEADNQLMTTGASPGGASIVKPKLGLYDFSGIQGFMLVNLKGDGAVLAEKAVVDVLNGGAIAGSAQTQADKLTAEGLIIGNIDNAPAGAYTGLTWYDVSEGKKPATLKKLEKILGAPATGVTLPANVTTDADFVIIIGTNGAN